MAGVVRPLQAAIEHYQGGDLFWAIRVWAARQISDSRARRRDAEWRLIAGRSSSHRFSLDRGVYLELPVESQLSAMIHRGDFELDEQCFIQAYLRPGDEVLDVGANLGLFTVLAAAAVGDNGRVHSFEPNPDCFRWLERNVALNGFGNVVCSRTALSDQQGSAEFSVVLEGWDVYSSLGVTEPGIPTRRCSVQTDTLDQVASKSGLKPGRLRLVKIDVEGWEEFVLRGAEQTLTRPSAPVIVFEANESAASRSDSSVAAVTELLRSYGYDLWTFSRLRRTPVPYPPVTTGWSGNLYAIKDLRHVVSRLGAHSTWRLRRAGFGLW